jgi:hypothetical protein
MTKRVEFQHRGLASLFVDCHVVSSNSMGSKNMYNIELQIVSEDVLKE